jgi:hypothetical protein
MTDKEAQLLYGGAMMVVVIGCVSLLVAFYVYTGKSARLSKVVDSPKNFTCEDASKRYATENAQLMSAVQNPWKHYLDDGEKNGKRWNGSPCDMRPDHRIDAILCSEDSERCMVPIEIRSHGRNSKAEIRDVFMSGRRMAYMPNESVFVNFDKRFPECSRNFRMSPLHMATMIWLLIAIILSMIAWLGVWKL